MEGFSFLALNASAQLSQMAFRRVEVGDWETGFPAERTAPMFILTQSLFGQHSEILEAPSPPSEAHYWRVLWHFVRGVALVFRKPLDLSVVLTEIEGLTREHVFLQSVLKDNSTFYGILPVERIAEIAEHVLVSHFASACKDEEWELASLRKAWDIEKSLPYDEPPTWAIPVGHNLGASLIKHQHLDEAWKVYDEVLSIYPHDGWALYGKADILCVGKVNITIAEGNNGTDPCSTATKEFLEAWSRADVQLINSAQIYTHENLTDMKPLNLQHCLSVKNMLIKSQKGDDFGHILLPFVRPILISNILLFVAALLIQRYFVHRNV